VITRFALVLYYLDRSGIKQVFGPYDTRAAAEHAQEQLEAMPAIDGGLWDVVPCTDLGHPVPAPSPITFPVSPHTAPFTPTPRWPDRITCTNSAGAE
jgi:hypothetical protein